MVEQQPQSRKNDGGGGTVVTRPIFSSEFWSERLRTAREPHHAVFVCGRAHWDAIAAKHAEILARHVRPADAILDAACGWGRMLDLMPADWHGPYLGVDLSPDFVERARAEHPDRMFVIADLRDVPSIPDGTYEWAIGISFRGMVIREAGAAEWGKIEGELRRVAKRLLILEYDPDAEGEILE